MTQLSTAFWVRSSGGGMTYSLKAEEAMGVVASEQ